jgi:hypothetical protein
LYSERYTFYLHSIFMIFVASLECVYLDVVPVQKKKWMWYTLDAPKATHRIVNLCVESCARALLSLSSHRSLRGKQTILKW